MARHRERLIALEVLERFPADQRASRFVAHELCIPASTFNADISKIRLAANDDEKVKATKRERASARKFMQVWDMLMSKSETPAPDRTSKEYSKEEMARVDDLFDEMFNRLIWIDPSSDRIVSRSRLPQCAGIRARQA